VGKSGPELADPIVPADKPNRKPRPLAIVALVVALVAAVALVFNAARNWSAVAAARKLKNPVAPTSEALAAGKSIYTEHCQRCHGVKGDGRGEKAAELSVAPGDFTDAHAMSRRADGEIFWQITRGRLPMPSFEDKLTEQQRWELVDYIRTFAGPPTATAPTSTLQARRTLP
jgi:mono/diheme cytochrome c family protein